MAGRMLRPFALLAVVAAIGTGAAWAEEVRITREMVVAAVERNPGPTKGREDAPITIVEFSDFQCGFCRRFWKETLPKIEAAYINPGKARFVYRHLIALGPLSEQAAHGAECAREQGKFWPYHDRLFEQTGPLAFTEKRLKEYARDLGLEGKAFGTCMALGRHRDRIRQETQVARYLGATGTPTFLINGQLLIGAQPFETFDRILDVMLADTEKARAGPPEVRERRQ